MKGDINELREHLFATLRGLRDQDNPLELDRARAISQVAGTLIDSARVEVEFIRATGKESHTGFVPDETPALPDGVVSVRRHRIGG